MEATEPAEVKGKLLVLEQVGSWASRQEKPGHGDKGITASTLS